MLRNRRRSENVGLRLSRLRSIAMAGLNDAFKSPKSGGDFDRERSENPIKYDRFGEPIDRATSTSDQKFETPYVR